MEAARAGGKDYEPTLPVEIDISTNPYPIKEKFRPWDEFDVLNRFYRNYPSALNAGYTQDVAAAFRAAKRTPSLER